MKKLVLLMGFPGSGKTTYSKQLVDDGYLRLNRDMLDKPGYVCSSVDFHKSLEETFATGRWVVIDNTYPTIASRKLALDAAHKYGYDVECWWLQTSIEETQYNVTTRMIKRYGKLVDKNESQNTKNDSNCFPVAVLFDYQKKFEAPTEAEGFTKVKKLKFVRTFEPGYKNKALLLDYDGTLRETISGAKYPTRKDDIRILPNRKKVLEDYVRRGYILLGVSNQSGCSKSEEEAEAIEECFKETNRLLGLDIHYKYCSHKAGPIHCYCRKPMPGLGVEFIEKYKLDPWQSIMVGDMTSDETFAKRCGFQYVDQAKFFL